MLPPADPRARLRGGHRLLPQPRPPDQVAGVPAGNRARPLRRPQEPRREGFTPGLSGPPGTGGRSGSVRPRAPLGELPELRTAGPPPPVAEPRGVARGRPPRLPAVR